ncbi:hypothetical protein K7X08_026317 [Anisodus acutangulus]|uniref:Uncharacterized protein n=1 Tax=Anisodus acutangulus TaxID=402998 RepID=A0A9Q1LMY5_9SOLA|nr:hypothetical protein K7X08_026317 [Anisodus acutangulus]
MVSCQEINNGGIAVSMSKSADENKNEGREQLCNEVSKAEGEKEGRTMQNDNVTTKELIENSFIGQKTRVEVVEGNSDLEEVVESDDQVIYSTQSDEVEVDVNNSDTTEALSKDLEHVVVEAGLSQKSHVKGTKKKYGNNEGQPTGMLPMRVAKSNNKP